MPGSYAARVYIFPEDTRLDLSRFAGILDDTRAARPDATTAGDGRGSPV